jgi:hypothetical protein
MKVVRKDKSQMCEFGELHVGEVFIEEVDGSEYIQIKMSTIESDEDYNAVSLVTGEPYNIAPDVKVMRVKAELIISNFEVGA